MHSNQTSTRFFNDEINLALRICQETGQTIMNYFHLGVEAVMKPDGTPVTEADEKAERMIRQAIAGYFPKDEILGEEEGLSQTQNLSGGSQRRWIIDPIDGTYNFARGLPFFSTLLALEIDSEVALGVVNVPATGDVYWAVRGCGAHFNENKISVSDISDLSAASINFGQANRILHAGFWSGFSELVRLSYRARGYGDYLGFVQVFEGRAEAMLEVGLKPWDLAPMKILVEEAGGSYADLTGGKSVYTGSCLVSNGRVHKEILDVLANASQNTNS